MTSVNKTCSITHETDIIYSMKPNNSYNLFSMIT